uniref:non-specific serine/threonine protein kinase n=1 Tax=Salarias fasciatus TaxID=181472 RepID=A0A672I445_SALFA
MPPKAKAAGKGRAPAKRKLAEKFPAGEVLTDTGKKTWKLGDPVGQGGFGLIYLGKNSFWGADAPYVIKVEPSENGPLFSELKFYMRAAKPDLISHKLKSLGVPRYWGSGLHEKDGKKYRFMVIDRLVVRLFLDILEYIHDHEYVHADIKASNLMLSHNDPNKVYLVDYGLAYRYAPDGVPKEYKEDPKRCHDGTIEFTSIDAHKGASACRRSDLEILSYCMVQWLCGQLPWEDKLQDALYVRDCKIRSQENISEFMDECFTSQEKPAPEVHGGGPSSGYQEKPSYEKLRSILRAGLKAIKAEDDFKLDFSPANGAVSPAKVITPCLTHEFPPAEVNGMKKSPKKKTPTRPKKASVARKRAAPKSRPEPDSQMSPVGPQKTRSRSKNAAS